MNICLVYLMFLLILWLTNHKKAFKVLLSLGVLVFVVSIFGVLMMLGM